MQGRTFVCASMSAPAVMRRSRHANSPLTAALCSAVMPSRVFASRSAPDLTRTSTQLRRPHWQAIIRGVSCSCANIAILGPRARSEGEARLSKRTVFIASMSAFFSARIAATSAAPTWQALCSGVMPICKSARSSAVREIRRGGVRKEAAPSQRR